MLSRQPLRVARVLRAAVRTAASRPPPTVPKPPPAAVAGAPVDDEPSFADKCRGVPNAARPPTATPPAVAAAGVTSFAGIAALSLPYYLGGIDAAMLIGSFGATAALVYGAPAAPLSQPRNVLGGHVLSALVGVGVVKLTAAAGGGAAAMAVAAPASVSVAIMAMLATGTLHPPAAATSLIAVMGGPAIQGLGWGYAVSPVATGASVLVAVAVAGNNAIRGRRYPQHWW